MSKVMGGVTGDQYPSTKYLESKTHIVQGPIKVIVHPQDNLS